MVDHADLAMAEDAHSLVDSVKRPTEAVKMDVLKSPSLDSGTSALRAVEETWLTVAAEFAAITATESDTWLRIAGVRRDKPFVAAEEDVQDGLKTG